MRVYSLMEDTTCEPDVVSEHGLSLYVMTAHHRLLFDAGRSGKFADNAAKLGINPADVDIAILSHGHYDHGNGLARFLEVNDHAQIYINRHAFGQYYYRSERYIGIDPEVIRTLSESGRVVFTDDTYLIDDELSLCTCNDRKAFYPVDDAGLTEKVNNTFIPDEFRHEQYLTVCEKTSDKASGRRIVLSGCSHKGILNIVNWLRPDVLIGGFHFMDIDVSSGYSDVLNKAAEALMTEHEGRMPTMFYTCHCTGAAQYSYLKKRMCDRLEYLSSGQTVEI